MGSCGALTAHHWAPTGHRILTTGHLWGIDLSTLGTYRALTSPLGTCGALLQPHQDLGSPFGLQLVGAPREAFAFPEPTQSGGAMGPAGTPPLKWALFPLGLPRMGGISAWAEPGPMGFQDGAGTSWDLLLIRALGWEVHVWLQQVISAWERAGGCPGARRVGTEGLGRPAGEKAGGAGSTARGPLEGLPAGRTPVCDPFSSGRPLCLGDV